MSEEERSNPDLIVQFGGKKELAKEAAERRKSLSERTGTPMSEVDGFIMEFNNMRKMMKSQMKGIDMDAMENADPNDPNASVMVSPRENKKRKKLKPTRGGGGGFGK